MDHCEQLFTTLIESLSDPAWVKDGDGKYLRVNQAFSAFIDMEPAAVTGKSARELLPIQLAEFIEQTDRQAIEKRQTVVYTKTIPDNRGNNNRFETVKSPFFADDGRVIGTTGVARNVTRLKETEHKLAALLKKQADNESTLRVLLDLRERDKCILNNRIAESLSESVLPYLHKLLQSHLDSVQKILLDTALANLESLLEIHDSGMTNAYLNLTPAEMLVAEFIRKGLTGKEIALRLSLSPATVATHRRNIRKRLGLRKKKVNLRNYLLSPTE